MIDRNKLKIYIPRQILNWRRKRILQKSNKAAYDEWLKTSKPVPPPHIVKEMAIEEISKEKGIRVFIETGTHKGEMVDSQLSNFDRIYSIELNMGLYQYNIEKFENQKNVVLIQGDSGEKLEGIIQDLKEPAVFWLDGHYDFTPITSKSDLVTPILRELEIIAMSKFQHVIFIDDARLFNGENDYPLLSEIEYFNTNNLGYEHFLVENDIIKIY